MGVEIERKWLLDKLPYGADIFPHTEIVQGYLCTDPVVRVRRDGDKYYLTYKGKGEMCREEYNLPLNKAAFETLCRKCDGILIEKTRYRIPIDENGNILSDTSAEISGNIAKLKKRCSDDNCTACDERHAGLTAEVDVFKGRYSGLVYAEVEFADEKSAESFAAPSWFREEVTYKAGYSNAELAFGA